MEYIKKWGERIGILGIAAMVAAGLKIFFFYSLMGVQSNFIVVWAITAFLVALLFSSFQNKWIPAGIYLVLSVLMFADAAYASFFNRYLSVNMLGAAGFLGDIGASLKAVLKPKFFLLFFDNILIFAALTERWKARGRVGVSDTETDIEEEKPETADIAMKQAGVRDEIC